MIGKDLAYKLEPVWGLNAEGEARGVWKPTGHDRVWFQGGELQTMRYYGRVSVPSSSSSLLRVDVRSLYRRLGRTTMLTRLASTTLVVPRAPDSGGGRWCPTRATQELREAYQEDAVGTDGPSSQEGMLKSVPVRMLFAVSHTQY